MAAGPDRIRSDALGRIALPNASIPSKRSAHTLPRQEGPLAIGSEHLSNAALFDLLDA
jgi:hypothetical protein